MVRVLVWLILLVHISCADIVAATELSVYIWDGYIADEVVQEFTARTGIKVKLTAFDSDQIRDEVVASTMGKKFDIILFDSVAVRVFGKNNQLVAINETTLGNLSHIDKRWQESCGNFGIPYFYGTTGIVYDAKQYETPPESWQALLMPQEKHKGHVVMVQDYSDTLLPALLYLGYSINSENEEELRQAYDLLERQVPYVLNYTYSLTTIKVNSENTDMHLALGYSGDQYMLNEATGTENWYFVMPKEGVGLWVDCLSVTSWSQYRQESLRFLDFLLEPKVAAKNTAEIYAATPNKDVRELLPQEAAEDEELFPDLEKVDNVQMYRILSDNNMQLRKRIVDTLKKRHAAQ